MTSEGKIASYKDNELTVVILGKKITAKVASGVSISVNVSDLSIAQVGDPVKAKLGYYDSGKPEAGKKPGTAMADEVEITLNSPLTKAKKGKATKGGKSAKGDKASAGEKGDKPNPFGNK